MKPRAELGPFVRNRVLEIRSTASRLAGRGHQVEFGHVSSSLNPADCATRGLDNANLQNHFWWEGPRFLHQPAENWRMAYKSIRLEPDDGEEEIQENNNAEIQPTKNIRFSSLSAIRRVVAYVIRFIIAITRKADRNESNRTPLSKVFKTFTRRESLRLEGDEIERANKLIVKQHQVAYSNTT
ncbi:unnamed protein product [Nippostrongylus brasiliensis]|uniref:Uncharacterized protein n=1 Tax=Nippostrongylus brasiliensis TaxID=27835 RepID=A0A0N4YFS9_NIPBR|nr:unnamed protein product [Nippostrongylus brasiliensis]